MKYAMGVDIGNTNSTIGLFDFSGQGGIIKHWRTVTRQDRTSDELGIYLRGFLQSFAIEPAEIQGFVFSSVVPSFSPIVERMAKDFFQCEPLRIGHENCTLNISYPRPYEIGADRLVNAVAVSKDYGGDAIIVDLGTATTFCLIHGNEYVGGTIAPGLKLSMEALHRRTAQLPPIEFTMPPSGIIGDSTVHAIQAGFFFGWVGLLREIINRIKDREKGRNYRVVATGGLATTIDENVSDLFDDVDPLLTLKGLQYLWQSSVI